MLEARSPSRRQTRASQDKNATVMLGRSLAPRWSGKLSFETEIFKIEKPTLLRFQSEGAIFVMYLKDEHGEVVQNLHHAGAGEGSYLIARSGAYSLQINGVEGWNIWLDPQG